MAFFLVWCEGFVLDWLAMSLTHWKHTSAVTILAVGLAFSASASHAQEAASDPSDLTPGERGLVATQGRRDVRQYSENSEVRGIGVFINMQKEAPWTADQIGQWVVAQFGAVNVPVEYRSNQSQGTATDITFYVRGIPLDPVNIADLRAEIPKIYKHYQGAWLPYTTSEGADTSKP